MLQGAIEESVRPISENLASSLQRTWTEMLLRARPKALPELDPDATTYCFAHHHLAGATISTEGLSGKFVRLGTALFDATSLLGARYERALDEVNERSAALSSELSRLPDPEPDKSDWSMRSLYGNAR